MIDSQMEEVKFGQRTKVGSKHVDVLKKLGTYYTRMNLLSEGIYFSSIGFL